METEHFALVVIVGTVAVSAMDSFVEPTIRDILSWFFNRNIGKEE